MQFRYDNSVLNRRKRRKGPSLGRTLVLTAVVVLSVFGILGFFLSGEEPGGEGGLRASSAPLCETTAEAAESAGTVSAPWAGPVLYHEPAGQPLHLVLVEKNLQSLQLYRYDGDYTLVKKYDCGTGEKKGRKREENDEKTPEGIYFNDRTFRDREITVFGDRAFGLTYPDAFDRIEGNRGSGIFIHGSNRKVTPYSSNGCIAMDNVDIRDLDDRVDLRRTPVIIGDSLPYRFQGEEESVRELVPFFKKALVPARYAGRGAEVRRISVLRFRERTVVMGEVSLPGRGDTIGLSRLYLAGPGHRLLVLLKREWTEEKAPPVVASTSPEALPSPAPEKATASKPAVVSAATPEARKPPESESVAAMVEGWRRAWEGEHLDEYIGYYHPGFSSKGKNLQEWKDYKGYLNRKYRRIRVGLSGLTVRVEGDRAQAYFRQKYRSDAFQADSYKILRLRKRGGQWKIYREDAFPNKPSGWPG